MSTLPELASDSEFSEILGLVAAARLRAVQAVSTTLIELYWQVGEVISRKIAAAEWGDGGRTAIVPRVDEAIGFQKALHRLNLTVS